MGTHSAVVIADKLPLTRIQGMYEQNYSKTQIYQPSRPICDWIKHLGEFTIYFIITIIVYYFCTIVISSYF